MNIYMFIKATDRLKSEEELARDEKERLEKLEVSFFLVRLKVNYEKRRVKTSRVHGTMNYIMSTQELQSCSKYQMF